jgi:hypothetical protein
MTIAAEYEWRLTIDEIRYRIPEAKQIVARALVLHVGWEMDNEVCAVEMNDGSRVLVGTSHGGVYEWDPVELHGYIESYELALKQSREVLAALK